MIKLLPLLIAALAVARLARLITIDRISMPLRVRIQAWNGDMGWWTYLTNCPYCMSVWIGMAVAPLYWWFGNTPGFLIPAIGLALSELTIFAHRLEG